MDGILTPLTPLFPTQAITYNWLFILVLSVLTFIVACAAASHHHETDGHDVRLDPPTHTNMQHTRCAHSSPSPR